MLCPDNLLPGTCKKRASGGHPLQKTSNQVVKNLTANGDIRPTHSKFTTVKSQMVQPAEVWTLGMFAIIRRQCCSIKWMAVRIREMRNVRKSSEQRAQCYHKQICRRRKNYIFCSSTAIETRSAPFKHLLQELFLQKKSKAVFLFTKAGQT